MVSNTPKVKQPNAQNFKSSFSEALFSIMSRTPLIIIIIKTYKTPLLI